MTATVTPPPSTSTEGQPSFQPPRKPGKSNLLALILIGVLLIGLAALGIFAIASSDNTPTASRAELSPTKVSVATTSPPVTFKVENYQNIYGLAADPADPNTLYAATTDGLLRSSDGGKTWADSNEGIGKPIVTAVVAVDDNEGGERPIYITTDGQGVFKSSDGGRTWKALGLKNRSLRGLAAAPGRIYAVAAPPFAGVYFSEDEGKTWARSAPGNLPDNVDIRSISLDPTDPLLVYIGTAPTQTEGIADYGRVKASRDGGRTWNDLPKGTWSPDSPNDQPNPNNPITMVVAAPFQRVWVSDGFKVYRLSPQRQSWQLTSNGLQGGRIYGLVTDPQVPEVLYAATESGFYRNTDGSNWVNMDKGKVDLTPMLAAKSGAKLTAAPALVPVNTRSTAISVNGLSTTLLYALNSDGWFVKFENRDFGSGLLASIPGLNNVLPDFSSYGGVNPASPLPAPDPGVVDNNRAYFPETGHYVSAGIKDYFLGQGGIGIFGYPITEEFSEFNPTENLTRTVQYFQRVRLEYHPNEAPNRRIKVGLLGRDAIRDRYFVPARFIPTTKDRTYFLQTRHTLSFGIKTFWERNGGLARFGYPITEEFDEKQPDGKTIRVQYFERAKLQYLKETNQVQVALLGLEYLSKIGWIKS